MLKWIWSKMLHYGRIVVNFLKKIFRKVKRDIEDCKGDIRFVTVDEIKEHLRGEAHSFFVGWVKCWVLRHPSAHPLLKEALGFVGNPYENVCETSSVNVARVFLTCLRSGVSRYLFGSPFSPVSVKLDLTKLLS